MNHNQVIVVEHFQKFPGDTTPSSHILGLYKYYNDKSLRHVFQHYKDVANDKLNCVTSLPLAPFEPRSPEEAKLMANDN